MRNPQRSGSGQSLKDAFSQAGFGSLLGWALEDLLRLAPGVRVVVIVDVLSFSTAVEIAVSRGACVLPYRRHDVPAADHARRAGALQARPREKTSPRYPYSLSPASMLTLPPGQRLVLPSPNGATLSLRAARLCPVVLAGSLRNARAVAAAAGQFGAPIAVIAAGESWQGSTGALRPALEDLLGAGAILRHLGSPSPEARGAIAAFEEARPRLAHRLRESISGRELIAKGYGRDVKLAAELDFSTTVPILRNGAFVART